MNKLLRYISEAHSAFLVYKEKIDENINICMGNVSCDMDSAIGAIALGYYLTYKNNYWEDFGNYEQFWIPVINCPRKELIARIDIAFHLKNCEIDLEKLVYIDDLDIDHYAQAGHLSLALIDHNKLDLSQEKWDNAVKFVVDHHVDLEAYPSAKKLLKFCGCACSMAINLIFENNLESILTSDICNFFSAPMLIDTENFKSSLKGTKWSDEDEVAWLRMVRLINNEYYNELLDKQSDRKSNLELGVELSLKKDYKNYSWKNCIAGISVIYNPIHEILGAFGIEELRKQIKHRMTETHLNFYSIMTEVSLKSGSFREFMFYDENIDRLAQLSLKFEKACPYNLQKKRFTGMSKNFVFYYIKDEMVSRKMLEPILHEIFESM